MNQLPFLLVLLLATISQAAAAPGGACDYRVRAEPGSSLVLFVDARCEGLSVDSPTFAYPPARSFAAFDDGDGNGGFSYRFDVDAFTAQSGNYRIATRRGDARMLTLASWLALPSAAEARTRVRLAVDASAAGFSSALPRAGEWLLVDAADLRRAGYTVFGGFESRIIRPAAGSASGFEIEVVDLRGGGEDVVPWIRDTAAQVTAYFGRFPVPRLLLVLLSSGGQGIDYGRVVAGGGATMLLVIGDEATGDSLYGEWVLVHEFLHLGSPFMADGFWFMEGFATYAEPIIRARAGWRSERSVWNEFYRDMPRGVPALTDEGLANTRSGLYWGGALFMLLADRGYRRSSDGRMGLEHCMREVLERLGNSTGRASVWRVMKLCDDYHGVPVMRRLADRYVVGPSPFDIEALWRDLGLSGPPGDANLDDDAPGASIRRAIVRRGADGEMPMDADAPDVVR